MKRVILIFIVAILFTGCFLSEFPTYSPRAYVFDVHHCVNTQKEILRISKGSDVNTIKKTELIWKNCKELYSILLVDDREK